MRELSARLNLSPEQTIIRHWNAVRAKISCILLTCPHLSSKAIDGHQLEAPQLTMQPHLSYAASDDPAFNEALAAAVQKKRVLRFLLLESDRFADSAQSTAKHLSQTVFNALQSREAESDFEASLICLREYFTPVFLGRLLRFAEGEKAMEEYLEWYEKEIEYKDEGRKYVLSAERHTDDLGEHFHFSDSAGVNLTLPNTAFSLEALNGQVPRRIGSYVLPSRNTDKGRELALLDYGDGLGCIGGGIHEAKETPWDGLQREVHEELGMCFHKKLPRHPRCHAFGDSNLTHIQHYFYAEGDVIGDLKFQEKGAKIVWVPIAGLAENERIPYPDYRKYLTKVLNEIYEA